MRQAKESEIIRLTMDIREGKPLKLYKGKEIIITDDVTFGMVDWADQVIVGTNDTRHAMNNNIRLRRYGVQSREPIEGDKIMCLKNDWHHPNKEGDVLVNGLIGTISNIRIWHNVPFIGDKLVADFLPDFYDDKEYVPSGAYFTNKQMDYKRFMEDKNTITANNYGLMKRHKVFLNEFDYAYCITCHKAQGSEYNRVLVLEEHLGGTSHQKWLYTACTRSAEKLILVRDYDRP